MIDIRRARLQDAPDIGEIHAVSWEAAHRGLLDPDFVPGAVRSRRTAWHDRLDAGAGTVWLAADDDRPLAFSYVLPHGLQDAEIFAFYCHPDGWGTGVTRALMEHTLTALHEESVSRAHLWTLENTPQSRRFYVKCGFAETGATRAHDFGDGTPLTQVEYARETR